MSYVKLFPKNRNVLINKDKFTYTYADNRLVLYHDQNNLYGMYIPLSDDERRFLQKVHLARASGHWEHGRNSNPVATLPHAAVVLHATI